MLAEAKGLLVGLFEDEEYENATLFPQPGNELLLYTDGVTEAINQQHTFFGTKRLEEALRSNQDQRMEVVLNRVNEFASGEKQNDDITILLVQFLEEKPSAITVEAKTSNLESIKEYVMKRSRIPEKYRKKIYLAIEEIFVNICMYGYEGRDPGFIEVVFDSKPDEIIITMKDDAMPYNPLENVRAVDEYNLDEEVGGLGKLLAFRIMDESDYIYTNEKNVLIMKKKTPMEE